MGAEVDGRSGKRASEHSNEEVLPLIERGQSYMRRGSSSSNRVMKSSRQKTASRKPTPSSSSSAPTQLRPFRRRSPTPPVYVFMPQMLQRNMTRLKQKALPRVPPTPPQSTSTKFYTSYGPSPLIQPQSAPQRPETQPKPHPHPPTPQESLPSESLSEHVSLSAGTGARAEIGAVVKNQALVSVADVKRRDRGMARRVPRGARKPYGYWNDLSNVRNEFFAFQRSYHSDQAQQRDSSGNSGSHPTLLRENSDAASSRAIKLALQKKLSIPTFHALAAAKRHDLVGVIRKYGGRKQLAIALGGVSLDSSKTTAPLHAPKATTTAVLRDQHEAPRAAQSYMSTCIGDDNDRKGEYGVGDGERRRRSVSGDGGRRRGYWMEWEHVKKELELFSERMTCLEVG
eukprot:CAMPEP_0185845678 /NCGR_PEP_ID=MMETSP1354-20130828/1573_1 /TAXON_ID=708628 /ORGANISM="Erythrolobus madagascarensis, Strain CCMP3276" /LENGTH=398 /DNA_ID=CAMNT_0028545687 /DNA_START=122 /DNA_END=1314 /DNA_ORIENTATION=+